MDEVVPDRILDVGGQPACLSFDPLLPSRLAVGTYNLTENESGQQKNGAILLYHVPSIDPASPELKQRLDLSAAVFDILWTTSPHYLIVALSDGSIAFLGLDRTQNLSLLYQESIYEPSIGITSIAYRPRADSSDNSLLVCTTSTGELGFFTFEKGLPLTEVGRKVFLRKLAFDVEPHDHEAWCVHFSERAPVVYSGGDDSVLKAFDISDIVSPFPEQHPSTGEPPVSGRTLFKDRKSHGAGVTAFASIPWTPPGAEDSSQLLLTGSYDETIRLFHYPSRKLLAEKRLDGGVWRIKVLPAASSSPLHTLKERHARTTSFEVVLEDRSFLIAASCMQAGARVVRLVKKSKPDDPLGSWSFELVASVSGMDLNYGFDYYRGVGDPWSDGSLRMFSISFYDRILVAWRLKGKSPSEAATIGIRVHKGSDTSLASRGASDFEIRPEDSVSNDGRRGEDPRSFPSSPLLLAKDVRTHNITPSEHTDDEEVPMQIEPKNMDLL